MEARAATIAKSSLIAALGEFLDAVETPPPHLSASTLRELAALIRRIHEATRSAEDCRSFLDSVRPGLAAEIVELRTRVRRADQEAVELRAKADRLRELEQSKVRVQIASLRRVAMQAQTDPSVLQAAAVQQVVAASRDTVVVASDTASDAEVASLRQRLELYRDRHEASLLRESEHQAELEALRRRAEASEAVATAASAESKRHVQLVTEYKKVGPLAEIRLANQTLAEYTALGTPGEIRRRLAADAATVQFLSAILGQTRQSLVFYEEMLGPTLLGAFRQAGAYDSALAILHRHRTNDNGMPAYDLGNLVLPSVQGLSRISPDVYQINGQQALDVMAREIARADSSTPITVQEERQRLYDRCTRLNEQLAAVRPDPDVAEFVSDVCGELLDASRLPLADLPAESAHGGGSSADRATESAGIAATHSHLDPSPPHLQASKRSHPTDATVPTVQPSVKKARSASRSQPVVDLTSSSPDATAGGTPVKPKSVYSAAMHAATRNSWVDWCPDWPASETTVLPTTRVQLEQLAWKFNWFKLEEVAPTNQSQCRKLIKRLQGEPFVSPREISSWHASKPWRKLLELVPEPLTFNPNDELFFDLYRQTHEFYKKCLRVYWERAHYLIVVPDPSHETWRVDRKNARSVFTSHFQEHCQRLIDFLQANSDTVDLDLLLDPFFLWPPGGAMAPLVVKAGETLAEATVRVDAAEPERTFFLRQPSAHPSRAVYDRLYRKFWLGPDRSSPSVSLTSSVTQSPQRRRFRSNLSPDDDDEEFPPSSPAVTARATAEVVPGRVPSSPVAASTVTGRPGPTDAVVPDSTESAHADDRVLISGTSEWTPGTGEGATAPDAHVASPSPVPITAPAGESATSAGGDSTIPEAHAEFRAAAPADTPAGV